MNIIKKTSSPEVVLTRVVFDFVTIEMTSIENDAVIFGAEAWIGNRLIARVMNYATASDALRELRFEISNGVVEIS